MNNSEIYKDVKGYEGIYQVSNLGNIKSLTRLVFRRGRMNFPVKGKMLKGTNSLGYLIVTLSCDGFVVKKAVHQIVAESFLNHTIDGHNIVVDHIDNNKLNNRLDNLQLVSNRENSTKDRKNSTGFLGVSKSRNRFKSKIEINGKSKHLGVFPTAELAHSAYLNARNNG